MTTLKNCPLCNGEGTTPSSLGNQDRFLRCRGCGILFDKDPQLIDYKNQFYDTNPFFNLKLYVEKGASLRLFAHFLALAEYTFKLLNTTESLDTHRLKLLEIGCGPGLLLDMAHYFGWDVQGVEPSVEASDFGRKVLELPILPELFTADLRIEGMDVVIASEVIEHLTSPTAFLTDILNALSDGGIALFTTPNAESKALEEKGDSWIYLGKDHLVLYTVSTLETVLYQAGFRSVTLWTFEGEYNDERIIAIAAKKKIAGSIIDTVRRDFGSDSEALNRCIRYLRYTLDRFDKQRNLVWQGALYRLVESLNAAQQYSETISTANRLEKFLQNEEHSYEATMFTLDKAHKAHNRSLFYSRVPTFIGNFYLARGLALLQMGKVNEALDDFYRAHVITEKLEALPDKSYDELAGMPPSLHALFHVGYALFLLGSNDEAASIFEKLLARRSTLTRDALAHTILTYGMALRRQRRLDGAISSFKEVIALSQSHKIALEIVHQATLELFETQLSIAAEFQREKQTLMAEQARLTAEKDSLMAEQARLTAELQAEKDSLMAEQARLTAELQAEKDSLMAEQTRLRQKNAQLQVLNQKLHSLSHEKESLAATLNRIYDSHGWKALLAYYQLRNWVFPPGSKRQNFAKAVFQFLLGDKKKHLTNNTISRQFISPTHDRRSPPSGPIDIAACTIISKNYIALARTLADSFDKFHPNVPFFVLLVDQVDGYFEPERERFYLVGTDELDIPDKDSFYFKYNILELNTAVKPYFLSHLFDKFSLKKLIYFDPDILITEKVSLLFELLDTYSIILIPHITEPLEDNFRPSELDLLQAGTYNLGFIGLGATPTSQKLLNWWQKRVYEQCLLAPDRGMHVDQKWMDFVPGLFGESFIMRQPGYNVAYWNLHSRTVDFLDGQIRVNGEPCYFFHFSGFDPLNIHKVSKHQNRFTLDDLGQAARLFEQYRDLLLANGHEQAKNWPYAFGYFDNGVKIPDIARLMYHGLGPERKKFGNPFSTSSGQSFFSWLNEPASRDSGETITRLWYEIYYKRPDVRQVWPDLFGKHREGFLQWISTAGKREHQIDDRLVPNMAAPSPFPKPRSRRWLLYVYVNFLYSLEQSLKPRLKPTLGRNLWIWNNLKRIRTYFISGRPLPVTSLSPLSENVEPAINGFRPFGVNLAGYFASEKGVGEAGRAAARALEASSIPYVLNNVTDSGSANIDSALSSFTDDNPYSINLIHVNADQVPIFAAVKGDEYFRGRYNIGCWFWELSQFPQEWYSSFQPFDEIWAASSFIQDSLARVSPVPVVRMPVALSPEPQIIQDLNRSEFKLPFDAFIFLFTFDLASVLERKNPLGLIKAFKLAFGDQSDAMLLLKVVHSKSYPSELNLLKTACSNSNIRIFDRVLTRQEMNTLTSISDCFVSLHRSEGFGISIAEAMLLEKPVIVTAYSANMDFTTPANSFLVKYKLVEIDRDYGPYRKGWVWADPDLEHAAQLMRYVYENRDICIETGRRGKKEMLQLLNPLVVGKQVQERLRRVALDGQPWEKTSRTEKLSSFSPKLAEAPSGPEEI
jgi:cyclopropane fatty-acyl-phospholipid synthase-like methyltransferase